jgi:hypothetical protein
VQPRWRTRVSSVQQSLRVRVDSQHGVPQVCAVLGQRHRAGHAQHGPAAFRHGLHCRYHNTVTASRIVRTHIWIFMSSPVASLQFLFYLQPLHKIKQILNLLNCTIIEFPTNTITSKKQTQCYCDLFFGLHPSSLCFATTTFRGMALPSSSGEPYLLGPIDRAISIGGPDDDGRAIPRNVVITKHRDDG